MEFSKRIAVIACIAAWGSVALGVISALMTQAFVPAANVDMTMVLAWTGYGIALAMVTTLLVIKANRSHATIRSTTVVGRLLLIAQVVGITGLAIASGGLLGCASVMLAVNGPRRSQCPAAPLL